MIDTFIDELVYHGFDWESVYPNAPVDVLMAHQSDAWDLLRRAYESEETQRNGFMVARYCGCSGLLELCYETEHVGVIADLDDNE